MPICLHVIYGCCHPLKAAVTQQRPCSKPEIFTSALYRKSYNPCSSNLKFQGTEIHSGELKQRMFVVKTYQGMC